MKALLTNKLFYLLAGLSAFFTPIIPVMVAVGILIFIDLVFGILAARKKGEQITSKKLSNTIVKMLVYQLLIITAQIVGVYLITFIPILNITLSFLGMVELFSVGESFTIITKKNFIKYIKDIIMDKLKNNEIK